MRHPVIFIISASIIISISLISSLLFFSCGKEDKTEPTGNKTKAPETISSPNDNAASNDFVIKYDLEGIMKGNMEIFRSGKKLKQNISSEIMGTQSNNIIYVLDGNVYSIIDIGGKKFGTKTDLESYNKLKQTGETITDFAEFEKFLSNKKISGTDIVLGKKCDIYNLSDGIDIFVFNKRYILKIKTPEFMATATSINTNPTFSGNEFVLPADIDFKKTDPKEYPDSSMDSLVNKLRK